MLGDTLDHGARDPPPPANELAMRTEFARLAPHALVGHSYE